MKGFYSWLAPTKQSYVDLSHMFDEFKAVCPNIKYNYSTELHVTLAHDKSATGDIKVVNGTEPIPAIITGFDFFGDSHIVMRLECPQADYLWKFYRAQGVHWDFPDYCCHLTVGKGTREEYMALVKNFNLMIGMTLMFRPEVYVSSLGN